MKTLFIILLFSAIVIGQTKVPHLKIDMKVKENASLYLSIMPDSTRSIVSIGGAGVSPNEERFMLTNKQGKTLTLILGDTLGIENNMPISEGAKIFVNWIKTYYDTETKRLKDENTFYKKMLKGQK